MNFSSETPCRLEQSAFSPNSPHHSSRFSGIQLRLPSSARNTLSPHLRSPQPRPQQPHLKSKFLLAVAGGHRRDPHFGGKLLRGLVDFVVIVAWVGIFRTHGYWGFSGRASVSGHSGNLGSDQAACKAPEPITPVFFRIGIIRFPEHKRCSTGFGAKNLADLTHVNFPGSFGLMFCRRLLTPLPPPWNPTNLGLPAVIRPVFERNLPTLHLNTHARCIL